MTETTPRVGERISIAPDAFFSYRRTGTISEMPEPGTHARVLLESGGIVRAAPIATLAPAPTLREQCPRYPERTVREATVRVVLERLGRTSFRDTAMRIGVTTATIGNWRRKERVPADRLQQLADALNVRAEDIRAILEAETPARLPATACYAYGAA